MGSMIHNYERSNEAYLHNTGLPTHNLLIRINVPSFIMALFKVT